jgi:hypothetical protein
MFVFPNAAKNIRRYYRNSILFFLICVIAALTFEVYIAGVDRTEKQLLRLPSAMPIEARVSSLDGARFDGLQIEEKTVDGLQVSSHVRDLKLTASLRGGIGEYSPDVQGKFLIWNVVGINAIDALEGLEVGAIKWLPGYGPNVFSGDETACVLDSTVMGIYGWSLGDSVPLNMHYYRYENFGAVTFVPLELTDIRIVGVAEPDTPATALSFIIPFETVRAIYHRQGVSFRAASASFYVRDALLLNEFKEEMKTYRLTDLSAVTGNISAMLLSNQGTSLIVNDAAFISAATRLRETLSLLKGFLPLLAAALATIGYFIAYLIVQSRREEYARYRLLGSSRLKSMGIYFTEIASLTLSGCLIAILISTAAGIGDSGTGVRVLCLFSVCYIGGSIIALLRLGRTNLMLVLSQAE